jgi:hypothetical protein
LTSIHELLCLKRKVVHSCLSGELADPQKHDVTVRMQSVNLAPSLGSPNSRDLNPELLTINRVVNLPHVFLRSVRTHHVYNYIRLVLGSKLFIEFLIHSHPLMASRF